MVLNFNHRNWLFFPSGGKGASITANIFLTFNSSSRSSITWYSYIYHSIFITWFSQIRILLYSSFNLHSTRWAGDQFPELAWYRRGRGFEYEQCLNFFRLSFRSHKRFKVESLNVVIFFTYKYCRCVMRIEY